MATELAKRLRDRAESLAFILSERCEYDPKNEVTVLLLIQAADEIDRLSKRKLKGLVWET